MFLERHKETMKADNMDLLNENTARFWTDFRPMNKHNTPLPQTVDGVTGHAQVTEIWKKHKVNIQMLQ